MKWINRVFYNHFTFYESLSAIFYSKIVLRNVIYVCIIGRRRTDLNRTNREDNTTLRENREKKQNSTKSPIFLSSQLLYI